MPPAVGYSGLRNDSETEGRRSNRTKQNDSETEGRRSNRTTQK